MYHFSFDWSQSRFHITIEGFWDDAEAEAFLSDLRNEVRRLDATGARYSTLVDAKAFPVQSTQVGNMLRELQVSSDGPGRLPTAVVVGSLLSKLQAERSVGSRKLKMFIDRSSACEWLESELRSSDGA